MDRIVRILIDDGWREYPDGMRKYARCFFKRFETPTRCQCNHTKDGMQVCCVVSELQGRVFYEIELCGELQDGTWVRLHQWSMPEDIAQGLAVVIPRLLATWEHIANASFERAAVDDTLEDIVRCENCGGSGVISYNPNLNPNSFPGTATAKCTRCNGTGIEERSTVE